MRHIHSLGLLAVVALLAMGSSPTIQAQSDSHYFTQTGHTVKGKFWQYWQAHGGLAQQGYPISDEMQEESDLNGKTYTVQYFERAVFELHPENKPPYDVLLSQLGTFRFKEKYAGGQPPAPNPPPPDTPIPNNPPSAGHTFTGHGSQVIPAFHLNAGLVVFHAKRLDGTDNFSAWLKDNTGSDIKLIANAIGSYEGKVATHVEDGYYLINVEGEGNWTIDFTNPHSNYSPPPPTQHFGGSSTDATQLFSLKAGLATFSSNYTGEDNFVVTLLDDSGNDVELVANEIGTSQSSKAINIPDNGVYLLQIEAAGSWTVDVQQ